MYKIIAGMYTTGQFKLDFETRKNLLTESGFSRRFQRTNTEIVEKHLSNIMNASENVLMANYENFNLNYDLTDFLSKIAMPTLVIHGNNDQMQEYNNGVFLSQKIPNSKMVTFEKGSHMIIIENAEEIAKKIAEFLSELE